MGIEIACARLPTAADNGNMFHLAINPASRQAAYETLRDFAPLSDRYRAALFAVILPCPRNQSKS
jgi:hypothetical protein